MLRKRVFGLLPTGGYAEKVVTPERILSLQKATNHRIVSASETRQTINHYLDQLSSECLSLWQTLLPSSLNKSKQKEQSSFDVESKSSKF